MLKSKRESLSRLSFTFKGFEERIPNFRNYTFEGAAPSRYKYMITDNFVLSVNGLLIF